MIVFPRVTSINKKISLNLLKSFVIHLVFLFFVFSYHIITDNCCLSASVLFITKQVIVCETTNKAVLLNSKIKFHFCVK